MCWNGKELNPLPMRQLFTRDMRGLVSRKKGLYHTIIPNRQRNQPRDDDSVNLVADRRKNEAPGWPRRGLAMGWWCG